jgi:hypothetical protein
MVQLAVAGDKAFNEVQALSPLRAAHSISGPEWRQQ